MENTQKALGKKISEMRKLRGHTQEELAEMVGLSPNFIGYLERGKQVPSIKTLKKIASALGVTIGWFFYSIENHRYKPTKLTEKDKTINKLVKILKSLNLSDIHFVLKLMKKISKSS